MMVRTKGGVINATPLTKHTEMFPAGTATTSMANFDTLRFLEDSNIEVEFNDGSLKYYALVAGFDFAIGSDVVKITCTDGSIMLG